MGRSTASLRLDDTLRARLAAIAADEETSVTTVVERLLREGIAISEHPGITFQSGPSGRRPALAGGPDVWEIAAALRQTAGKESERIAELAREFGIHERQVNVALNYAAAHREEIEKRVRANDMALQEAERIATSRKSLIV